MTAAEAQEALGFLAAGSETGRDILAHDWSRTPLGPIETWPGSLRTVLAMMLGCPAPMYLAWGPGLVSFYNDAYRPIFGDRIVRALGAPFPEIWADLWDTLEPMVATALAGGQVDQRDLPLTMNRHGTPEETWWSFSYSPVHDDSGRVAGMICVTTETTARVVAERRRRESDARLRMALSAGNGVGTWDWDIAADRVTADARFAALYGVDPAQASAGAPIAAFFGGIHADDRARVEQAVARAVQTGRDFAEEYRLVQPDGSVRWVVAQGGRTQAGDGTPLHFPGVSFDITARKDAERALRESEDRFRAIANSVDQMIWSTRADGYHDYYNDRWYAFTGVPYGSTDGEAWNGMFHPDDQERARGLWRHSLATGEPYHIEYRLRHRSGRYRWVLGRAQPVHDAEGPITRWFGTCTDIHDLKVAQERRALLLALHDNLRAAADPNAATLAAATMLGRHVGAARAGYGEVDAAGGTVRVERDWTRDASIASLAGQFRSLDGFGPRAIADLRAGLTLVVADAHADPRIDAIHRPAWDDIGCRAIIVVPLVREGQLRVLLYLHEAAPRDWDAAEIALAEDFAQRTWDIVERARAEEAVRANARELHLIADALPVLIAFVDDTMTYRFANAAYEDWFGLTPDRVIGRNVRDILDDATFEARRTRIEQALAGQESRFETDWPHRDGRERIAELHYLPRHLADGRIEGFYVFVQDVTDRKRVEAMLERQVGERTRERDRLWQATNDLMGTAGLDGFLKAVNPAWNRLLGWSEDELLARPFLAFVDEADHAATAEVVARLAAGEPIEGFVDHVVRKDGGRRIVMWTAIPEGEIFSIVGRDITEQRQAEEALRQSQKMEAVGQLTGGIAHDFNNLLTGIVGSLDLMQTRIAQGRTEAIEKYAKAALSSANRAAALTHRLLAFARRQPLEPKTVNANTLVTCMEDLLRRTLTEQIHLEIVTAGGLWPTLCDPHQLENAILNLAINARDAMPAGGRLVIETCNTHLDHAYARMHREVSPGQYICICVTDNGTGMPAEVREKAFDPFFTTKPLGQGTGLGLSMIYGFARQSDGHAKIYSEPGQGTTVKIYLPRHRGGAASEPDAARPHETHRARRGETVLVVEDEPVVRDLIVEVLGDLGYRALEAEDGPAGLRILQSGERIDLLVTDVGLPGLNGRQLADGAREARPALKVLFITGYAENATFGNGHLESGMQMITKPFPVETLAARIREMIEGR